MYFDGRKAKEAMAENLGSLSDSDLVGSFQSAVARAAPAGLGLVIDPMAAGFAENARALRAEIFRRLKLVPSATQTETTPNSGLAALADDVLLVDLFRAWDHRDQPMRDKEALRDISAEVRRRMSSRRLFDESQGPAKLGPFEGLGGFWCIGSLSTTQPIRCGGCGTEHPADPGSTTYSDLGGLIIVDSCCGAWIDQLFRSLARPFTSRFWELLSAQDSQWVEILGQYRMLVEQAIAHADLSALLPMQDPVPEKG